MSPLIILAWLAIAITLWRAIWYMTAKSSWAMRVFLRSFVIAWCFAPTVLLGMFPVPFLASLALMMEVFGRHEGDNTFLISSACFLVFWGLVAIVYHARHRDVIVKDEPQFRVSMPKVSVLAPVGKPIPSAIWRWVVVASLLFLSIVWLVFEAISPPVSSTVNVRVFFVHGPLTTHSRAMREEKGFAANQLVEVNKEVLFWEVGIVVTALGVATLGFQQAQVDEPVSDAFRASQMLAGSTLALHSSVVLLPLAGKGVDTIWILHNPVLGLIAVPALLPSIFAAWVSFKLFGNPENLDGIPAVAGSWQIGILLFVATSWTLLLTTDLVPAISNGFLGGILLGSVALWISVAAEILRRHALSHSKLDA